MADVRISQLLNIQRRYLRSTQLERDFRDPTALQGYVVTAQARQSLDRIAQGLDTKSGQRAWRITGDYGSGKSSFALLLAHLFAGHDSNLPPQIRRSLDLTRLRKNAVSYLPILVTGSREPLSLAVARAVNTALQQQCGGRSKLKVGERLSVAIAKGGSAISDQSTLEFILEVNSELIARGKTKGLFIILDELGKFLEFAALHPDRQDVFFLQQLAEVSTRSGREPIFTVGLLHQGFNAYADMLSQSAQKEWEKVAGRFEEILFDQPLDQVTQLIGSALNISDRLQPRGIDAKSRQVMRTAATFGWFGAAPAISSLVETAPGLYPLHPTLVPVLVKLFSRFGQNERSLFSFLLSSEPFGLQSFAQGKASPDNFYLIHNLYDYAAANFGHRLSVQSYRSHWNHIDSLIRSFPSQDGVELAVLKTVGLLNLINSPELIPTDEAIALALGCYGEQSHKAVLSAIRRLQKERHVLFWRGHAGGYCLWSHTSVNLESAYESASRALGHAHRVAAHIADHLDVRPIVARRHYIQTGNLRHFDVAYCGIMQIESVANQPSEKSDGRIIIPLCETPEEQALAIKFARSFLERADTLIAITEPLASLSGLLLEVQRWSWIQSNTPELKDDRYAAEEVARQLSSSRQTLEKQVQHYAGLKQSSSSATSLQWYHQGKLQKISSATALLSYLSDLSDDLYVNAPVVHNELINRRNLSSAAASARMRLIDRMFNFSDKEALGMDSAKKPPEMSIYLSLLKGANLHVQQSGVWTLQEPTEGEDPCNLLPGMTCLKELLRSRSDTRVPVTDVLAALRRPPYGIRDGIIPILLVLTLLNHEHEIALYENGTFLSAVAKEEILRLTKAPDTFDLQFCRVQGIRRTLFDQLTKVLDVNPRSKRAEILDIVRPLCVFVAQLPEYTRNTARLSLPARAARDSILAAREPGTLLFKQLPEALDIEPFEAEQSSKISQDRVQEFVICLKSALDELKTAYPHLMTRIREKLLTAFDAPKSALELQTFRNGLSQRCQDLVVNITDIDLKAFCLRLLDNRFAEVDWLESVGSYVATTPPSRWKDNDETVFTDKLEALVKKFRRVESVHFSANKPASSATAFRVALTARDGTEKERVIHLTAEEDKDAKKTEQQISRLLAQNDRVSITAMSRVIWRLLENHHEHNAN
jgi:hypothetical protein